MAGIIGGINYGVAKDVNLVTVKVLDSTGFGTVLEVLSGIEYVAEQGKEKGTVVANMSFGGPNAPVLNDAVSEATRQNGKLLVLSCPNETLSSPMRFQVRI